MGIRRSLAYSFTERYASLGIQFLSTVIIARLLSPQEIGIYSVGAGVIAIAQAFRDFGVSAYLIQEPELTQERQRAAFTVTLVIAWMISLTILMGAETVAEFYSDIKVRDVLSVLALCFFIIPFGSVTLALLRRDMAFNVIFRINVISTLVHSGVGLTLAILGYGFMSLAWAAFAGTLATVVGALMARPATVILMPSTKEIRRVLGFGGKMSLVSFASEAGNSAPDLVIGRTHGFDAVGYFSRAMGFVMLFERIVLDGLRGVLLPYFSSENRSGSDMTSKIEVAVISVLGVSWPMLAFMGIMADQLIMILYGSQWQESAMLAQMIVVAIAIRCLNPIFAALLVSMGKVNQVTFVQLGYQSLKIVIIVISSFYGLKAICVGLIVSEIIGFIGYMLMLQRSNILGYKALMHAVTQASLLVISACGPVILFFEIFVLNSELPIIIEVIFACAIWLLGVIAGIYTFSHPLKKEIESLAKKIYSNF
ncbi:MAG: lipopolysaccharide biosynthesis protein [Candidatus Polarisedimenticolaceae bacterium]|nr:lipopolysaccharide biosynthesis protein [Candidatus Polarisedimenticolaceae bacterium]